MCSKSPGEGTVPGRLGGAQRHMRRAPHSWSCSPGREIASRKEGAARQPSADVAEPGSPGLTPGARLAEGGQAWAEVGNGPLQGLSGEAGPAGRGCGCHPASSQVGGLDADRGRDGLRRGVDPRSDPSADPSCVPG